MNTLKITTVLALLLFCAPYSHAQKIKINRAEVRETHDNPALKTKWYNMEWFADLNFGTRWLGATSDAASLGAGMNVNASLGYFFTDRFGIKGRVDFSDYAFTPDVNNGYAAKGNSVSTSVEAMTDLIPLIYGTDFRDWRVKLHSGFGWTTYRNTALIQYRDEIGEPLNDPGIQGNEDMFHLLYGVCGQYHINGRWSINLDVSNFVFFKQDFTFDNYNRERMEGIGGILATTIGLNFRL